MGGKASTPSGPHFLQQETAGHLTTSTSTRALPLLRSTSQGGGSPTARRPAPRPSPQTRADRVRARSFSSMAAAAQSWYRSDDGAGSSSTEDGVFSNNNTSSNNNNSSSSSNNSSNNNGSTQHPVSLSQLHIHDGAYNLQMFSEGYRCPICSKLVIHDELEFHLIICLTKPRITYNDDVLTQDKGECVICLEDLEVGQSIARLPCLCVYHKGCIDDWFQVNRSCPEHPGE